MYGILIILWYLSRVVLNIRNHSKTSCLLPNYDFCPKIPVNRDKIKIKYFIKIHNNTKQNMTKKMYIYRKNTKPNIIYTIYSDLNKRTYLELDPKICVSISIV